MGFGGMACSMQKPGLLLCHRTNKRTDFGGTRPCFDKTSKFRTKRLQKPAPFTDGIFRPFPRLEGGAIKSLHAPTPPHRQMEAQAPARARATSGASGWQG